MSRKNSSNADAWQKNVAGTEKLSWNAHRAGSESISAKHLTVPPPSAADVNPDGSYRWSVGMREQLQSPGMRGRKELSIFEVGDRVQGITRKGFEMDLSVKRLNNPKYKATEDDLNPDAKTAKELDKKYQPPMTSEQIIKDATRTNKKMKQLPATEWMPLSVHRERVQRSQTALISARSSADFETGRAAEVLEDVGEIREEEADMLPDVERLKALCAKAGIVVPPATQKKKTKKKDGGTAPGSPETVRAGSPGKGNGSPTSPMMGQKRPFPIDARFKVKGAGKANRNVVKVPVDLYDLIMVEISALKVSEKGRVAAEEREAESRKSREVAECARAEALVGRDAMAHELASLQNAFKQWEWEQKHGRPTGTFTAHEAYSESRYSRTAHGSPSQMAWKERSTDGVNDTTKKPPLTDQGWETHSPMGTPRLRATDAQQEQTMQLDSQQGR